MKFSTINIALFLSILFLVLISISVGGYFKLPIQEALNVLLGNSHDRALATIIDMRMRRALTSIAVGIILGVSSVALQNILRNPLASPFTLGIQHSAALGVAIAMFLPGALSIVSNLTSTSAITITNYYVVGGSAFIAAMLESFLILLLSYAIGLSVYGIILASMAISFAIQAILSLLEYLYFNEIQVATIVFWTFGDVGRTTWQEVWILMITAIVGIIVFLALSTDLDLVMFGDDIAISSGVNVKLLRIAVLLISSLLIAISVSLVGVIGFAGLVASHLARLTVGWSSRRIIISSALYGAIVLLLADFIGRVILNPVTLPVGITTTLVGVPLLIALMLGGRHGVSESRWG